MICLQEEAFYTLLDKVCDYIKGKDGIREEKWIISTDAMKKLGITSNMTLLFSAY